MAVQDGTVALLSEIDVETRRGGGITGHEKGRSYARPQR